MARIPESELIINGDGSVFHLHLLPEDLADTIMLVGDQGRVPMAASLLNNIEVEKQSREFNAVTGYYNNKRITILSTGIGTDNIDIVMNELDALANINFETREINPDHKTLTILRVGTCGGLQPDMELGEFVFSEMGLGCDGLLNWYQGREQVNDKNFETAFLNHIKWDERLPSPYFVRADEYLSNLFTEYRHGITMSAPGFYAPQGRTVRLPIIYPDFPQILKDFEYEGLKVTNIEMENSALAAFARMMGHRAATICTVVANRFAQKSNANYKNSMLELLETTLNKLTI